MFDRAEGSRAKGYAQSIATSVAGWAALESARQLGRGKDVVKTWVTGQNARPAHSSMNGQTVPAFQAFSNGAQWPRDPVLPAYEVANCNCTVELSTKDGKSAKPSDSVEIENSQFGKKARKHCADWRLDPSDATDRQKLRDNITGIIDGADRIDKGEWRGQPGPCTFYLKGNDLVIVNAGQKFVTIMKGGGENKRYRNTIGSDGA